MTTEEVLEVLRRKERSKKCASWMICREAANAIDELQAEKKAEEERKHYLKCPFCGGRLSEDRGGYRHCYACHFEYETGVNR